MNEINKNLYPPDGYVFREADGSHHRGGSWKDLQNRVKTYREINSIYIGDVWADIVIQVCARLPNFCRSNAPVVPPRRRESNSLNTRISAWVGQLLAAKRMGKVSFVPDDEARRRASICLGCPMQKPMARTCGACITLVDRSRRIVFGHKDPVHQGLLSCDALGEDSVLAVHLVQPPREPHLVPSFCWRKE